MRKTNKNPTSPWEIALFVFFVIGGLWFVTDRFFNKLTDCTKVVNGYYTNSCYDEAHK